MSAVKRGLRASADVALEAGVPPERLIVDPGIGFGKTPAHNLVVLRRLGELGELGYPILIGPSRKSFLGRLFGQDMPIRPWGTAAAVTAAILRGADIVRVHDLPEMMAVIQVAEALRVS
jgi:dihydropteroate synthase